MNNIISANELKTKGISVINRITYDGSEAIITVRGKTEFVILPIRTYNRLRDYELEMALQEARNNIKKGKYIEESVDKHIKRITHV